MHLITSFSQYSSTAGPEFVHAITPDRRLFQRTSLVLVGGSFGREEIGVLRLSNTAPGYYSIDNYRADGSYLDYLGEADGKVQTLDLPYPQVGSHAYLIGNVPWWTKMSQPPHSLDRLRALTHGLKKRR